MSVSLRQRQGLKAEIQRALHENLYRPPPMTGVDWADSNFYMSSESSYSEGNWVTSPSQIALLNMMCNDNIREFNFQKAARLGYTKLLMITMGYMVEHKKRNVMAWFPDDGMRDDITKQHVEPMIRDVPALRQLFPWLDKKHKKNTLDYKCFSNLKQIFLRGGKAAKNFREKSPDTAIYDELSKFDRNIEREGNATFLGDKRVLGSPFKKSIRGSSPTIDQECQIQEACLEADELFRYYVPCPHCKKHQTLKFGGKDLPYGLKWNRELPKENQPESVYYVCEHEGCCFTYDEFLEVDKEGYWESENLRTWNGIDFFSLDGESKLAPRAAAAHQWAVYSNFSPWSEIVVEWNKINGSLEKRQGFVNTTLGETWIVDEGEKAEPGKLFERREHYISECPVDDCIITAAVDTQDDRLEIDTVAWISGEESYRLSYRVIVGDPSRTEIWNVLKKELSRKFKTPSGVLLDIKMTCIDSGGHFTDEVYNFSKKVGLTKVVPIKGASKRGRPVATWPKKRHKSGVYLVEIGTDTAKDVIHARLNNCDPGEGYMHFPVSDEFNEDYFEQLCAEKKILKIVKGFRIKVWDAQGRRNEATDTAVYNLAAIRLLQQNFGIDLDQLGAKPVEESANSNSQNDSASEDFIGDKQEWL